MKKLTHLLPVLGLLLLLTACGAPAAPEGSAPINSDARTAVPDLSVPAATPKTRLPEAEARDYTGINGTQLPETVTPGEVSFTVLGGNFYYNLDEITVKEGDAVTINFRSAEGFHDWVLDEFNAATDQVSTGQDTSVTFVADKKGTFEFYCSVGSHRANGMVGTLTVE